jgi:hypothetical protein
MKILRKVLLKNRQILRPMQTNLAILGAVGLSLFGTLIITGDGAVDIDVSKYPSEAGYVLLWGGIAVASMMGIDNIYRLISRLKRQGRINITEMATRFKLRFKNRVPRDDSLLARIRECEEPATKP